MQHRRVWGVARWTRTPSWPCPSPSSDRRLDTWRHGRSVGGGAGRGGARRSRRPDCTGRAFLSRTFRPGPPAPSVPARSDVVHALATPPGRAGAAAQPPARQPMVAARTKSAGATRLDPRRGPDVRLALRATGRVETTQVVRPPDGPPRAPARTPGPRVTAPTTPRPGPGSWPISAGIAPWCGWLTVIRGCRRGRSPAACRRCRACMPTWGRGVIRRCR